MSDLRGETNERYRPRPDDHLVEPVLAGLGIGDEDDPDDDPRDDDALEGFHEVAEHEPRGFLLRFLRSAREIMRGGQGRGP